MKEWMRDMRRGIFLVVCGSLFGVAYYLLGGLSLVLVGQELTGLLEKDTADFLCVLLGVVGIVQGLGKGWAFVPESYRQ